MSGELLTPDQIQMNLQVIMQRRAEGRKRIRDLELAAGEAKSNADVAFALAKESLDEGTVSAREAHALVVTDEVRRTSRQATTAFNYAKGLMEDLKNDQMAWQSILKNFVEDGA